MVVGHSRADGNAGGTGDFGHDSGAIKGHRGSILHFLRDPADHDCEGPAYEYFEDGILVVEHGRIVACGDAEDVKAQFPQVEVQDHSPHLIVPGFVDCHVHYPQTEMIAAYGEQLLEWLDSYVFPVEAKFGDHEHASQVADFFVKELLRSGTTTALTFCTVHEASVDALFEASSQRNMLMIAGKVLMDADPYAPEQLRMSAGESYEASKRLIDKWHKRGRCLYAVTPRFAITSTPEELQLAGKLLTDHHDDGVYLHTHLNENKSEIELATSIHASDTYLSIYDKAKLLGPRSVFAHCVHMKDCEWKQMKATESVMAFCPTSNLFLGSGLVDLHAVKEHKVRYGLGSDVGGGTSFCQLQTLNEAYKVGQLSGYKLDPLSAFYLLTLGSASALSLDDRIGNFVAGKEADFVVLDTASTPLLRHRVGLSSTLQEKLFLLATLGDDRCVAKTYVAGCCQHQRQVAKSAESL